MLADLELRSLLEGFLEGDPVSAETLHIAVSPMIRGRARSLAPELKADQIEEIVQETFLVLWERGARLFDPDRSPGAIRGFLFWVVKTAVQRIRARYSAPGRPSRWRKHASASHPAVLSLDQLGREVQDRTAAAEFEGIEIRRDLQLALRGASALVVCALIAVHVRNERLTDVARRLGISRFQLHRQLRNFTARWHAKAVCD